MKKFLLAAVICGLFSAGCKKEDKTYCYVCETTMTSTMGDQEFSDMDATVEQCGITEDEAKAMEGTVTTSMEGMAMKATTVCNKK